MNQTRRILLISGSLRNASGSSAALRTAASLAPKGVDAILYDGLALLPPFNPDDDVAPLPATAEGLRAAIRNTDALLFATPEYAGGLPGAFKNLLDWTIGDDQPGSIADKPVAWINCSPRGVELAHASLRTVLGYAHAQIVESACVDVPLTSSALGSDGLIGDQSLRTRLRAALVELARQSGEPAAV